MKLLNIHQSLILCAQLTLLKALVIWSLESSEAVKAIIKESYKQSRHDDDLNQPLSVQAWGRDGDRRRFWLIEGQDDTHFRLYRESNPALKNNTWRSVAGTIEEVKEVAQRLDEENTQASRRLRDRIHVAIPRFEASEEVSPSNGDPISLSITATKSFPETKTERLSSGSQSTIRTAGTRLLPLRRSDPWEATKVYLLGRRGWRLRRALCTTIRSTIRHLDSGRISWTYLYGQRSTGQI